jgi:hypothetical protein
VKSTDVVSKISGKKSVLPSLDFLFNPFAVIRKSWLLIRVGKSAEK